MLHLRVLKRDTTSFSGSRKTNLLLSNNLQEGYLYLGNPPYFLLYNKISNMATRLSTYHKVIDLLREAKQNRLNIREASKKAGFCSNYLYQAVRNIKLDHDIENALYQEVMQLYDDVVNQRWDTPDTDIEELLEATLQRSNQQFREEYIDELPEPDLKAKLKEILAEYNGEELKTEIEKLLD